MEVRGIDIESKRRGSLIEPLVYYFDPKTHTYTDSKRRRYISATTFLNKFKKPFDTKLEAIKYAVRHGGTPEYWINEWKRVTDNSLVRGRDTHDYLEDGVSPITSDLYHKDHIIKGIEHYIKDATTPLYIEIKYQSIADHIMELINNGFIPVVEKRIFSIIHKLCIAGTPDLALFNNKDVIIDDYKTNKDILREKAGYYRKVNGVKTTEFVYTDERLLPPLEHLQASKQIIYELQINLYGYKLKQKGYNFVGGTIHHIDHDDNITHIPVRNFQKEIEEMIKYFVKYRGKIPTEHTPKTIVFGL